ncbi:hypothetical protein [Sphingorhabdus sp. Alg231-15]|uniref:hypothetical protein n=1 Tax=Sphingorhabdus sp. Alg231-15 TaxID=1922222 RepID=UPI000D5559B6
MQIIESTVFGVRSAIFRFENAERSSSFTLFPMVHVADRSFYDEVLKRLASCDVILTEGVRTKTGTLLTASYRYFTKNQKLGLVLQSTMSLDNLTADIRHADVASGDFSKKWAELPFLPRFLIPIIAPVYGLYLRYFGTRESIGKSMGLDLHDHNDAILDDNEIVEKMEEVILDWRDKHLIGIINGHIQQTEDDKKSVGIVFGARHMRAVIHHLHKQNYKVTRSDWASVIRY